MLLSEILFVWVLIIASFVGGLIAIFNGASWWTIGASSSFFLLAVFAVVVNIVGVIVIDKFGLVPTKKRRSQAKSVIFQEGD